MASSANDPPSDSHACHAFPSQNRSHSSPSSKTANTSIRSAAHAVTAGADASVPPSDSGSRQPPSYA